MSDPTIVRHQALSSVSMRLQSYSIPKPRCLLILKLYTVKVTEF